VSVHVYPINDLIEHELHSIECVCGPDVYFVDDETGETLDDALVVHHSLDGRELLEEATS
jgi:hypothetical protein